MAEFTVNPLTNQIELRPNTTFNKQHKGKSTDPISESGNEIGNAIENKDEDLSVISLESDGQNKSDSNNNEDEETLSEKTQKELFEKSLYKPKDFQSKEKKPWRFQLTYAFLTYARSGDLTKERVLETFEERFGRGEEGKAGIQYYCIGKEIHKSSGLPHIHCVIKFAKCPNFRRVTVFDIDNRHPYVAGIIRSIPAVIGYSKKEGDYISNWPDIPGTRTIHDIEFDNSLTYPEYMEEMRFHHTEKFILFHDRIKAHALRKFKVNQDGLYDHPPFKLNINKIPRDIIGWAEKYLWNPNPPYRLKCLLLWGPSYMGKTVLAKLLAGPGNYVYWGGLSNVDTYVENAKALICDEMDIRYCLSWYKLIMQGARNVNLTGKYRPTKMYPGGKACIWCCNDAFMPLLDQNRSDDFRLADTEKRWIKDNCVIVNITQKMYDDEETVVGGKAVKDSLVEDIDSVVGSDVGSPAMNNDNVHESGTSEQEVEEFVKLLKDPNYVPVIPITIKSPFRTKPSDCDTDSESEFEPATRPKKPVPWDSNYETYMNEQDEARVKVRNYMRTRASKGYGNNTCEVSDEDEEELN